jgi:hypothetical protein
VLQDFGTFVILHTSFTPIIVVGCKIIAGTYVVEMWRVVRKHQDKWASSSLSIVICDISKK